MERLSRLLPRTLHKHGMAEEARASLVTHRANAWIASRLPLLHKHCMVQKLQGGELTVLCNHPAVAQEIAQRTGELEEHLRAGEDIEIRVRISRSTSLAKGAAGPYTARSHADDSPPAHRP